LGRSASHSPEKLAKERSVWEVHLVGNLRRTLVGVSQLHLNARGDSLVYPLLGGLAADRLDQSAHVSGRDEESPGIEVDVVLLRGVAADELHKVAEQLLLARESSQTLALGIKPVVV